MEKFVWIRGKGSESNVRRSYPPPLKVEISAPPKNWRCVFSPLSLSLSPQKVECVMWEIEARHKQIYYRVAKEACLENLDLAKNA